MNTANTPQWRQQRTERKMRIKTILAVTAASLALSACGGGMALPGLNLSGPPSNDVLVARAAGVLGITDVSRLSVEGTPLKQGVGAETTYVVRDDSGNRWACSVQGGDALNFVVHSASCNRAA
ncbi:hypothetical protein KJ819_02940 [Patescibacteria group bacterium]|nr:hypothetical protein [Patescibacteria group bacterium]MBU1500769.1 hypothetical protein [Patescibacteria group bacterium]MBU2080824.1 hypothetical protein [Patescibacteria group bacterium]MBU2123929.1 hypothetical protein [Patescibacteria group bacterium]MBU2194780.1 hypothetical protein [Patescibacteria group bacterium]